jgi:predicted oxidoreductase
MRGRVLTADRIPTEHEEQREVVRWFRQTYKGVRIFAIPNGGQRSIVAAAKLKAEGVSSGVPDLHVPAWSLWIEMKRSKGGSVSAEQKDWMTYLEGVKHWCIVGKGADDAKAKITAFFNQQKDTL